MIARASSFVHTHSNGLSPSNPASSANNSAFDALVSMLVPIILTTCLGVKNGVSNKVALAHLAQTPHHFMGLPCLSVRLRLQLKNTSWYWAIRANRAVIISSFMGRTTDR